MALAQDGQQVVERRADVAHVDLDVREGRRPERDHDVLGLGRVGHAVGQRETSRVAHALEQFLGAGLLERHRAALDGQQPLGVVVDSLHVQAAVGEAQRQRQAHPSEADDRDVYGHG